MANKQSPESFVQQYLSLAQAVGAKTGVAPASLLGQWGLETGWGKSVIPGTNNLGNIKDFSGQGPKAVDNQTKTTDAYRAFDTPEGFGDHYTGLLGRKYKSAMNAGEDSTKFFTELKRGGYAEDAGYVQKGVQAANRVNGILGSMPSRSPLQLSDEAFTQQAVPIQAPVVMAQAPEQPEQQAIPVPTEQVVRAPQQQVNPWAEFQKAIPVGLQADALDYSKVMPQLNVGKSQPNFLKFKSWLDNA